MSQNKVFFSLYGNGDTIRIGQEIQCLPYAGFLLLLLGEHNINDHFNLVPAYIMETYILFLQESDQIFLVFPY